MAIDVSLNDVASAEAFLVQYLTEKVPEADFSPGSAVRDLCVSALSYAFALLRKELQAVRARQSLRQLALLPADEDVDEAIDDILSNLFINRALATPARAVVRLTFSSAMPDVVFLPSTTSFRAATGPAFVFESGDALTLLKTAMRPGFIQLPTATSPTEVLTADVTLVCAEGGTVGNIPAQVLTSVSGLTDILSPDATSASFISAEIVDDAFGGVDRESTAALLRRAPAALSTRNLVNSRAITNTLLETVPEVSGVTVIGSGEPEMVRDEVTFLDGGYTMRVGGMVDVYCRLPRTQRTVSLTVGDRYLRPDGLTLILRDTTVNFENPAPGKTIVAGDVISVKSGFSLGGPEIYTITHVDTHELTVERRTPFPEATDEYDTATPVTYSVGSLSPSYDDKILLSRSGYTSRSTTPDSGVVLPSGPCYRVRSVSVNGGSGRTVQVNKAPESTEFSTYVEKVGSAQTSDAITALYAGGVAVGDVLTINYDTVSGLTAVQSVLSDPDQKTVGVDILAKALHPVYVSFTAAYRVTPGYVDPGTESLRAWVKGYVENYRGVLRTSTLQSDLRDAFYPQVDSVDPLVFEYSLYAPDGQVFRYRSGDVVSLVPALNGSSRFIGAGDLRAVNVRGNNVDLAATLSNCTNANDVKRQTALTALSEYLAYIGVSDRTIRLLPADTIQVVRYG